MDKFITHCSQYVEGGGHIVMVYGACEVSIRCVKGYYEWVVYEHFNQVAGPPMPKIQKHNVDKYKYLPDAAERAAYLVNDYLERIEKAEEERAKEPAEVEP